VKKSIVETLRLAKALIRKGWTKRWFAGDAEGHNVESGSAKAVRFCAVGAVSRVSGRLRRDTIDALAVALHKKFQYSITAYNDAPRRTKRSRAIRQGHQATAD
jgi:hypothetical protein